MDEGRGESGTSAAGKNAKNLGIRLEPQTISEVKAEAARRGITVRKLFEELWQNYLARRQT